MPVDHDEVSLSTSTKITLAALRDELETAYKVIVDLGDVIKNQDLTIAKLRERLESHGIKVLEKTISELTREELIALNKSIPKSRFQRVDSKDKAKPLTAKELAKTITDNTTSNMENVLGNIVTNMFSGAALEKHGIDPNTMTFKPGWGPNGRIIESVIPKKLTFSEKVRNLLTSIFKR